MTAPLEIVLGESEYIKVAADPPMFVRAFDTLRDPWDFQVAYMRAMTERKNGRGSQHPVNTFKYRIAVLSLPRQNSKTTISAWLALWRLYTDPDPQLVVSVALDKEGARRILDIAREIIASSSILRDLVDTGSSGKISLFKNEIVLKDGRRWLVKSADALYARGLSPSTVLFDELGWSTDDGDLYRTLTAAMAAQPNPLLIVTSTVSPVMAGPLYELSQSAEAGAKHILWMHDHENKSPLITQQYLDQQLKDHGPVFFNREHRNEWGSGTDVFCSHEDYEKAVADSDPRRMSDDGPCYGFLDLGWIRDESVLAISKREGSRIAIVAMETWQGSKARPVSFEAIEGQVRELIEKFNVRRLTIESPQGVQLAQRLQVPGCSVEVLHPTAKSQREVWGALYTNLHNGTVWLPKDAKLRRQLLTLTIQQSATGWRIVEHDRALHQDRALASAGSVMLAESGVYQPLPEQPTRINTVYRAARGHESVPSYALNAGRSRFKGRF